MKKLFYLYLIILLFILSSIKWILIVVVVQNYSMYPTYKHGDKLLVVRYWPKSFLQRGDIIIIWPWPEKQQIFLKRTFSIKLKDLFFQKNLYNNLIPYLKRIIGIEGDLIQKDIYNEYKALSLLSNIDLSSIHNIDTWSIPKGYLFVQGDNPTDKWSSISWGPVPITGFLGKVLFKLP